MKKYLFLICLCLTSMGLRAAQLTDYTWAQVCSGSMGAEWYGSAESQQVADIVLDVQKNNGGWMKNDQLHKLTTNEYNALVKAKGEHSCLDNYATTQEMRFLAKVYQGCKVEKYREAFVRGLQLIFASEKSKGGWSQYWPLSGNGSYQDYITYNDDLMTNVLKMLLDIHKNTGDFLDIVDAETREKCQAAFDRGIDCIIACQVDDNGTPAAWCAQHDPNDLLPTEGRPHEHPSISGYESASLLSFLMTLDKPSPALQQCIHTAVAWLDNHKYMDNAAIEDYTNAQGEKDRHIVSRQGSAVWGRFIQLGGESGKKIYDKFYKKLKDRGKKRTHHSTGYEYYEYQILEASYDTAMAYQPVFGIYSNDYPELFYRHLYNYDDTPETVDKYGQPVATSLMASNRRSYQYLGSWCYGVINVTYPAWKERVENQNQEYELFDLSASNNTGSNTSEVWQFGNGFSVTNEKGKGYATGRENTVKYSAGVPYTIHFPQGIEVMRVAFYGYDNYDADAYISQLNGVNYGATDYVFPAKQGDTGVYVKHTFDFSDSPVTSSLGFTLGNKQCCLIINIFYRDMAGLHEVQLVPATAAKAWRNGTIVISKDGQEYGATGAPM